MVQGGPLACSAQRGIPTLTMVGFLVGSMIGGAVVTEAVFSWPGVGRLIVLAVATAIWLWSR